MKELPVKGWLFYYHAKSQNGGQARKNSGARYVFIFAALREKSLG